MMTGVGRPSGSREPHIAHHGTPDSRKNSNVPLAAGFERCSLRKNATTRDKNPGGTEWMVPSSHQTRENCIAFRAFENAESGRNCEITD